MVSFFFFSTEILSFLQRNSLLSIRSQDRMPTVFNREMLEETHMSINKGLVKQTTTHPY